MRNHYEPCSTLIDQEATITIVLGDRVPCSPPNRRVHPSSPFASHATRQPNPWNWNSIVGSWRIRGFHVSSPHHVTAHCCGSLAPAFWLQKPMENSWSQRTSHQWSMDILAELCLYPSSVLGFLRREQEFPFQMSSASVTLKVLTETMLTKRFLSAMYIKIHLLTNINRTQGSWQKRFLI